MVFIWVKFVPRMEIVMHETNFDHYMSTLIVC